MKTYLRQWNVMRVIRLALGLIIIFQGWKMNDRFMMGMGLLFSLMPLLNTGCCGGSSCSVPSQSPQSNIKK